jgi:hypothetical protein
MQEAQEIINTNRHSCSQEQQGAANFGNGEESGSAPVAALLPETPDGNDEVSPHESASVSSAPIQSDASTDEDHSTSLDAEVSVRSQSADPAKVSVSGAVYANC